MPTDAHSAGSAASRDAGSGPGGAPAPGPRIRPTVAALLGVETLLLAATATYCFVMVTAGGLNGRFGIGLGVFLLIFAAGTALAARSILVAGRFGLGYGITWQLFQALVGASLLRSGLYWPGGLALGLALVLFVLLLNLVRSTPLPGGDH